MDVITALEHATQASDFFEGFWKYKEKGSLG